LAISKYIEEHFDREVEDYELTVCSAGLDNAFMVDEQYQKNIGKEVGVLLKNGKRKKGVILSYDETLLLEVEKKKKGSRKEYITEKVLIPKDEIKETKLKINFK
jgi:ribosome maturation factor RimP